MFLRIYPFSCLWINHIYDIIVFPSMSAIKFLKNTKMKICDLKTLKFNENNN